jgi:predicted ATPase
LLTRLEANGFKNLLGFYADFGPFTCLAGPNGVGKSNVFDAIRFLSLLADHTLMEAALLVRGSDAEASNLRELFWTDGCDRLDELSLVAEMIVEPDVVDDFGRPARASSTFLRYEVTIGYEAFSGRGQMGRLSLRSEKLTYITQGDAVQRLRFPHSAHRFRRAVVQNRRRAKSGYISTTKAPDGQIEILVHQDGGSAGNPKSHAASAPRTIVATSNTAATPTILAARREMQRWRVLALEPSAMRGVDRFYSDPNIDTSGRHLPATLSRLATEAESSNGPEQLYARITGRLAQIVPVRDLQVDVDEVRQLLSLRVREDSGIILPARSLSDGTLRFLTLCVLQEDASCHDLVCMEEPENGIHPARMEAMVKLLRAYPVDPNEVVDAENPLRQMIVATHSPAFVALQEPDDLLFATDAKVRGPAGNRATTLRCRALNGTWRVAGGVGVGQTIILDYLELPLGSQQALRFTSPSKGNGESD